ncbi:hypothetical protein D9757_002538 [Collybiopsis confluens]|uniref:Protein kinase domain-containing protein n=1 Tax=Collybiopsis confluens TaxID=2823264 RepID=A0A8H5MF74_9AGAR|nr:hypothetical protein D9757_002538 [Collybiopsis confluens]
MPQSSTSAKWKQLFHVSAKAKGGESEPRESREPGVTASTSASNSRHIPIPFPFSKPTLPPHSTSMLAPTPSSKYRHVSNFSPVVGSFEERDLVLAPMISLNQYKSTAAYSSSTSISSAEESPIASSVPAGSRSSIESPCDNSSGVGASLLSMDYPRRVPAASFKSLPSRSSRRGKTSPARATLAPPVLPLQQGFTVLATMDTECYVMVKIVGNTSPKMVRECLLAKFRVNIGHDSLDQAKFLIYQTEIGSSAISKALSDEELFERLTTFGDDKGTSKFLISRLSINIHKRSQVKSSDERIILVTADSERYITVRITEAKTPTYITEWIFTKLRMYDKGDRIRFLIYKTEIGAAKAAPAEAISEEKLFELCKTHGDAKGTLKFLVQPDPISLFLHLLSSIVGASSPPSPPSLPRSPRRRSRSTLSFPSPRSPRSRSPPPPPPPPPPRSPPRRSRSTISFPSPPRSPRSRSRSLSPPPSPPPQPMVTPELDVVLQQIPRIQQRRPLASHSGSDGSIDSSESVYQDASQDNEQTADVPIHTQFHPDIIKTSVLPSNEQLFSDDTLQYLSRSSSGGLWHPPDRKQPKNRREAALSRDIADIRRGSLTREGSSRNQLQQNINAYYKYDKGLVQELANFFQTELDSLVSSGTSDLNKYRERCLQALLHISKSHFILPSSFVLEDIQKVGSNPIAAGGFSDVWQGLLGEQSVGLKVLRLIAEPDEDKRVKTRKQFCNEALLWRQLKHPNILTLLGVNIDLFYPSFCLISPWMVNRDIVTYLKRNPEHNRHNALLEIANGLSYLHSREPSVVHGDVRGANILVTNDLHCCLADFGLARVVAQTQVWSNDATSSNKGTIRWMAPELFDLKNSKEYNWSRDIYAFACTIIEILSLKIPFPDLTDYEVVLSVAEKGAQPCRPQNVWCPDPIWEVTTRCLARNPKSRPSAQRVYEDLFDLKAPGYISYFRQQMMRQ